MTTSTASAPLNAAQTPHPYQEIRQTVHHQIVIIGGGAAGITTAAQLLKKTRSLDIAIIEPSDKHYYQPGWTLVGGGVFQIEDTVRSERDYLPKESTWIQDYALQLDPDNNTIITQTGIQVTYDYLIVCAGIQIDWHLIKGLKEALGKDGVTSNYSHPHTPYTWELINNFQGGNAIFTYPNTPIKCGGAPQKIMYMADDIFRSKMGVRNRTNVIFCTATSGLFPVPEYAKVLQDVVARREIEVKYRHNLKAIKPESKQAIFERVTDDGVEEVSLQYDMIHVAPPMSAPDFIKNSPLAVPNSPGGWVNVDKDTLQHKVYPNVFSLGDASSLPTSKTAAAIRKQAPVLVENLLATIDAQPLQHRYNGYTCCPLITGYDKTVMAEFDYENKLASSFPINPAKERWSMWLMKKHALPWLYWNRMLKGEAFEGDLLKLKLKK